MVIVDLNFLTILFGFVVVTLFSITSCFFIKKYFKKLGIIDVPNKRSSHVEPVILSGGVGFLTVFALSVCYLFPELVLNNLMLVFSFILLFLVSFYDDLKQLSSKIRFFVHFLVGNAFFFSNVKLLSINLLFLNIQLNNYMSYFCTVFFVMALINIYNFMDGIDGYAGGVGVFASLFFGVSFLFMQNFQLSLISFVLAGALLGFLFFNFPMPKAKMFMGDVGSAVLGAIFSFFSLQYSMYSFDFSYSILIPMMVLGVFICDASITLFIRLFKKENILEAHRSHFYQKLNIVGWSHRKILIIEYGHILLSIGLVYLCINFKYNFILVCFFVISFVMKFILIQRKYNYIIK